MNKMKFSLYVISPRCRNIIIKPFDDKFIIGLVAFTHHNIVVIDIWRMLYNHKIMLSKYLNVIKIWENRSYSEINNLVKQRSYYFQGEFGNTIRFNMLWSNFGNYFLSIYKSCRRLPFGIIYGNFRSVTDNFRFFYCRLPVLLFQFKKDNQKFNSKYFKMNPTRSTEYIVQI